LGIKRKCGDRPPLPPLPVPPGKGWGEGDLERRASLLLEITLTLTLPEYREKGDWRPFATSNRYALGFLLFRRGPLHNAHRSVPRSVRAELYLIARDSYRFHRLER
jgi:hypothetical protein